VRVSSRSRPRSEWIAAARSWPASSRCNSSGSASKTLRQGAQWRRSAPARQARRLQQDRRGDDPGADGQRVGERGPGIARGAEGDPAGGRRSAGLRERVQHVDDQLEPAPCELQRRRRAGGPLRVSRLEVVRGEAAEPVAPLGPGAILEADVGRRLDGVAPGQDRCARVGAGPVQLGVALAQEPEGVLVEPEPDVQPVLLDPAVATAAAGTLAPEPPSSLVDDDAVEAPAPAGLTEPPRGGEPAHPATEDGDPGTAVHEAAATTARASSSAR
jgi:hypothetical protein